jgi:hypothetical protein
MFNNGVEWCNGQIGLIVELPHPSLLYQWKSFPLLLALSGIQNLPCDPLIIESLLSHGWKMTNMKPAPELVHYYYRGIFGKHYQYGIRPLAVLRCSNNESKHILADFSAKYVSSKTIVILFIMNRSRIVSEVKPSRYKFFDTISTIIPSPSSDFSLITNLKRKSNDQIKETYQRDRNHDFWLSFWNYYE